MSTINHTHLDTMLWDIAGFLAQQPLEEGFSIEPFDDPLMLEIGFRHTKAGQEWVIGLRWIKNSDSPYKHVLATSEGRRQMAVGMAGVGFLKPEDILRIDVKKSIETGFWEFNDE